MIIGVDGNEANVKKRVGVSIYALNLLQYFKKHSSNDTQFIIYLRNSPLYDLPEASQYFQYEIVPGPIFWSQFFLPLFLYLHKKITIFFSPAHYVPRFCPVSTVVTIHDLAYLLYPNEFLQKDLFKLTHWTKHAILNSKKIIAVSKTTKKDICKNYHIEDDKINVIYNGYQKSVKNPLSSWQSEFKVKEPTILYVGTLQPRKNINTLIQAFVKFKQVYPEFKLMLAGKKGWMYDRIFDEISDQGLNNDVYFTDYISDYQLMFLYKNVFCLVMPSYYEGFGIPVLEAMSFGCPVISSFSSSLPEVGGDASLYFDPNNMYDLFEKLSLLKRDNSLKSELIKKGLKRVKDFSWEKCGEETLKVIKDAAV
ncbi:MAG: glycosyltransferase family 1 protein [bacterium]|nr:glycosyltransferase family 1 protein [bacterium]